MISTQVRTVTFLIAAACSTTMSWGQEPATQSIVPALLSDLHSQDTAERAKAFDQLRANPTNLKRLDVRAALLGLLDRENHGLILNSRKHKAKVMRTKVTRRDWLITTAI
jgi:hypothetical protein